jgi:predicted HTH transcriptional regulator
MGFINRNMRKLPEIDGFNSLRKWEIPKQVFEEIIVNALIHRDYYISSTIKVFIFRNRVEIISPGKLPNALTIDNVKSGISVVRNPVLHSIARYILPYVGLGTGIYRALTLYPDIEIENKTDTEQFKVTIKRNI